jgi:hypothetical protein
MSFEKAVQTLKEEGEAFVLVVSRRDYNDYQVWTEADGEQEYSDCFELARTLSECRQILLENMKKLQEQPSDV